MASQLSFLAQRLFNAPLAIHPRKAEIVIGALAERLGVASLTRLSGEALALRPMAFDDEGDEAFTTRGRQPDNGYDVVAGVAVVPVRGTLVQRLGGVRPWSGMTGYDTVRAAFLRATQDPVARAIVLDIDSPGGEVAGCFDLVDEIYRARGAKPIRAILSEVAYSGAYAIASAADSISVPRTGGTGSIGVVCAHVDWSKALAKDGLAVTFIQYGARKSDGAPEKPLANEALARFQADIDTMGELFVATVARNRNISKDRVRATEAATFMGDGGVAAGLADTVFAPDAAFREVLDSVGGRNSPGAIGV